MRAVPLRTGRMRRMVARGICCAPGSAHQTAGQLAAHTLTLAFQLWDVHGCSDYCCSGRSSVHYYSLHLPFTCSFHAAVYLNAGSSVQCKLSALLHNNFVDLHACLCAGLEVFSKLQVHRMSSLHHQIRQSGDTSLRSALCKTESYHT